MILKFNIHPLEFLYMCKSVSSKLPQEFISVHSYLPIGDIPGSLTFHFLWTSSLLPVLSASLWLSSSWEEKPLKAKLCLACCFFPHFAKEWSWRVALIVSLPEAKLSAPSVEWEALKSWINDEVETLNPFFQLLPVLLSPKWPILLHWCANTFQGLGVIETSPTWDRSPVTRGPWKFT